MSLLLLHDHTALYYTMPPRPSRRCARGPHLVAHREDAGPRAFWDGNSASLDFDSAAQFLWKLFGDSRRL